MIKSLKERRMLMKLNNGVDLVSIKKMKKILNSKTINKIFTEKEQEYWHKKENNFETIAGMFAAKEAFLKSLNQGLNFCDMKEIEILHDEFGSPYFNLSKNLKKKVSNISFTLSISHDENYAIAFVIALYS